MVFFREYFIYTYKKRLPIFCRLDFLVYTMKLTSNLFSVNHTTTSRSGNKTILWK